MVSVNNNTTELGTLARVLETRVKVLRKALRESVNIAYTTIVSQGDGQ